MEAMKTVLCERFMVGFACSRERLLQARKVWFLITVYLLLRERYSNVFELFNTINPLRGFGELQNRGF
jgi:hypothetical protein